MNLDPSLAFALGVLCTFCLTLIVALTIGIWLGAAFVSWVKKHVSVFDDLGARREDGKVRLSGNLQDLARPSRAKRAKPATKPNGRRIGAEPLS